MSGHNKWSKIKRKKEAADAKKSKVFSKFAKLITAESKQAGGDINSPALKSAIEQAKAANMPLHNIERAVKKGASGDAADMQAATYEAYGPGGSALIIECLTDNTNRTAAEIKHLLSKNNLSLAGTGSVLWAFEKKDNKWLPQNTLSVSDEDRQKIEKIIEELENQDDVQKVFTNIKD
ncbi:MAG: YebC/PmpR family DNA-binding transcriptional regulator [Candidatus Pacebacteria bacterium]|nr:YebC/PmpR family DNA-binding transcriptional regulator [Candidatus Paceibacterota bacterium]